MVDRTATPPPGNAHAAAPDAARLRPEAVAVLERLLLVLFPAPPSLDCITIDDVLRRYRLTGLGAPALTAIEQSQRIVRARGDYSQTGQCEFHIGLIYFHWDDYRAAANQFALARQPWTLAGDDSANCLSRFAQGLALYHAYHNEPAMLQFGRAERLLARPAHGAALVRHAALAEQMRPLLAAAQEALREDLWPADRAPERAERGYLTVPPLRQSAATSAAAPGGEGVIYGQPPPPSAGRLEARRAFERPARPAPRADGPSGPINNLNLPGDRPAGSLGSAVGSPIAGSARGPVPGHVAIDARFAWYVIADRRGDFLPAVTPGAWLLADSDVDEHPGGEYVIVGSRQAGLGSITVQAVSRSSVVPFCYLGRRAPGPDGASLVYLDNGPLPIGGEALVLAVVEGFWQALEGQALVALP